MEQSHIDAEEKIKNAEEERDFFLS